MYDNRYCACCHGKNGVLNYTLDGYFFCDNECFETAKANREAFKKAVKEGIALL